MRYVSLFSGCDGLGLGLARAGMTCVAHAEINKHASKVLARRWPETPNFGDVSDVKGSDFPDHELICGGFPCTDISIAGNREGLAGEHSGLWFEFARLLGEVRPAWCLIENVDALLSSNGGRDLGTILGALGQMGYGYAFRVLDSQWAGVAQRRKRLFIVGSLGSVRAAEVLLEPEGSIRSTPPSRAPGQEVAGTLGGGTPGDRGYRNDLDSNGGFVVASAVTPRYGSGAYRGDGSDNLVVMRWREGKPGGGKGALLSDKSLTLATSNDQYLFEGDGVRRFTPRETERLQGFPDDWTRYGPDGEIADVPRYAMTGNAVTVNVAEWIGRRIMRLSQLRTHDSHNMKEEG